MTKRKVPDLNLLQSSLDAIGDLLMNLKNMLETSTAASREAKPSKAEKTEYKAPPTDELGEFAEYLFNDPRNIAYGVELEPELAGRLATIADRKGLGIYDLIRIKMTAYCNAVETNKIVGLDEPMPFGQYRGLILREVIMADSRYIKWLSTTSEQFEMSDEAQMFMQELES